jgi:ABC-type tungstate transport system substrate-binding protein
MGLPQLQQDKANHVIYGVLIFAIVAALSGPVMGLAVAIYGRLLSNIAAVTIAGGNINTI